MFKNRKNFVSISPLGGKIQLSEWKKSRSSRPEVFCQKGFLKISQNHRKAPALECFLLVTDLSLFCKTKVNGCFIKPRLLLNSIEQFPEFQSDDVNIFAHKIGNAYTVKILSFIKSSRPKVLRSAILLKKRL